MLEVHKITGSLPGTLKLAANSAGIPGFATYLRAVKLAKDCPHLLGPIWARPDIAALSKRLLVPALLTATDAPTVRPPHHRPTLRLAKG